MNTSQKILNKVVLHLNDMTRQSFSDDKVCANEQCAYRNSSDEKCPIGAVIDDIYYHPGLETYEAISPVVVEALSSSLNCSKQDLDDELLGDIQWLHDSFDKTMSIISFPDYMASGINHIALKYGLMIGEN